MVGVSRQPRMFITVDLPDPLGPMTATKSPSSIGKIDAAQRLEGGLPLAVGFRDAATAR